MPHTCVRMESIELLQVLTQNGGGVTPQAKSLATTSPQHKLLSKPRRFNEAGVILVHCYAYMLFCSEVNFAAFVIVC